MYVYLLILSICTYQHVHITVFVRCIVISNWILSMCVYVHIYVLDYVLYILIYLIIYLHILRTFCFYFLCIV